MAKDEIKRDELAAELSGMSDPQLKEMLEKLSAEEERVSYRRRVLHGKIDVMRAELVRRLKDKRERGVRLFTKEDINRLGDILAKEAAGGPADAPDDDLF
jgi:hypothetical protein